MNAWLLPLVPAIGTAAILLVRHHRTTVARLAVGTVVLELLVGLWGALTSATAEWTWWDARFHPGLAVAGLGRVMVVLVPLIAVPVVLYAAASMREDAGLPRLLALLVAFTGAMELLVIARDFLTLLVGWELVGACSWALIGYEWRDAWRVRDALTAFLTTRAGDLGLYLAAAAAFAGTGSLRLDTLGGLSGLPLQVVAAGVLLASAAKSAQLPFSPWLFAAMAGPTPASALLHSATMVAAGAFLLARVTPALAAAAWLAPATAWLGLATALAGGLVASVQSDIKKALAASTSAQYGLMLVAIGAGWPSAAGVHLVAHAAFKALLFLGAGVALHAAGTLDLARMGLGRALPRAAALVAVGALALAAVPPLGGAYSKEQIVAAAASASSWLLVGTLVAGSLGALYAGRIYLLAFGPGKRSTETEPARAELWSLGWLAAVSLALGLLWLPGASRLIELALGAALPPSQPWELTASLGSVAAGGALSWALWRRRRLVSLGLPTRLRLPIADWLRLPDLTRTAVVQPTVALARALAAFDDRVVDAGIRAAARAGALVSGTLAWWGERGFDGLVAGAARVGEALADWSGRTDDSAVDRAVEGLARQVGAIGREARRLQTGLTQQYYVLVAIGVVIVVAIAALGRYALGR